MPFATPAFSRARDLRTLDWPPHLTVAVLAPHPDDFDAIGVTLRFFHERGDRVRLAVLTGGASGVEDGFAGARDDVQKAALREIEQADSCRFFGLPDDCLQFLRLAPDEHGNPLLDEHNHALVRDFLLAHQPDIVCMPHGNDSNVTHQRTYQLFRAIAVAEKLRVWALLNQDAKTIAMHRELYVPFEADVAGWKAELLRFHRSQHARNLNTRGHGFDERVLQVNRQAARDLEIEAEYAEVFELEGFGN